MLAGWLRVAGRHAAVGWHCQLCAPGMAGLGPAMMRRSGPGTQRKPGADCRRLESLQGDRSRLRNEEWLPKAARTVG